MTKELLNKYNMLELEEYKKIYGDTKDTEMTFYQTFLFQTDYIPNKIIEAQITGIACGTYDEELQARQYCREQINLLRG